MTKAPPGHSGAGPFSSDSAPSVQLARHTVDMAIRFTAQADTREECVEGLELLVAAGLIPVMLPV